MSQIRLCINRCQISCGKIIELSKEERKYLFNVLRLKQGDTLSIFDGKGRSFHAKIIDLKNIEVLREEKFFIEEPFSIILCQALLKGEKMDLVIEKATELGVKKIIPFVSSRCIVKNTRKVERWIKIAKEASEQSLRIIVPDIEEVTNFQDLIKIIDNGVLFWEKSTTPLVQSISDLNHDKNIYLLVGPEGGFTQEEVTMTEKRNIKIASLGKRILKAETASIVSVALVSFLLQSNLSSLK
ncbi:MAG: RsmE family RNA methyltransferase [Thermodesulfovibrio sp.]|nr:16S rRNA (uracil(1498)-N(3))-methyltransferase [Thermodesulfovibrio sp.]MDW7998194.1 RsmE family RNA methyltransferase [Thermodesulfovibrio sp.]